MYKLTPNEKIIHNIPENIDIFIDTTNARYQQYLAWLAEGNTPEPAFSLDELKERKVSEIKQAYDQALNTPLEVTVANETFNIDVTEKAQVDWMKLMAISQITSGDVSLRDADNNTQTLTSAEFIEVVGQIGAHIQTLWANRCSKIDLARSADTQETLDTITF